MRKNGEFGAVSVRLFIVGDDGVEWEGVVGVEMVVVNVGVRFVGEWEGLSVPWRGTVRGGVACGK